MPNIGQKCAARLCRHTIVNNLVQNSIFISLFITALCVIFCITFLNIKPTHALWRMTFWLSISLNLILYIHHYAVEQKNKKSFQLDSSESLLKSIDHTIEGGYSIEPEIKSLNLHSDVIHRDTTRTRDALWGDAL